MRTGNRMDSNATVKPWTAAIDFVCEYPSVEMTMAVSLSSRRREATRDLSAPFWIFPWGLNDTNYE